jgi:plastocyanin
MSNGDLFYICGAVLAVSAVVTAFAGLRLDKFPGRLSPVVALWFVTLIGATTTLAVLHAQDEEAAKAAETAVEQRETGTGESAAANPTEKPAEKPTKEAPASAPKSGPGGTLKLAADPAQIAFDTTRLSSKPGKVTIDFDNPAALEHDVAIEQGGKTIAVSDRITEGKTSVTAELAPGEYTFLCTVPGHAQAGMKGTLTVE